MDLTSYADQAVRLVNTTDCERPERDGLADLDALRRLVKVRPHLNTRVTRADLDALRSLRAELRAIFVAASQDNGSDAVDRINALLIQHPIHPQISSHEDQPWHLHLTESGSVADKYAAGAVMGLAVLITEIGVERLGICQAAPCQGVFLDTTTNRSRRYCADRCASRANVAAYRARRRDTEDTGRGAQFAG